MDCLYLVKSACNSTIGSVGGILLLPLVNPRTQAVRRSSTWLWTTTLRRTSKCRSQGSALLRAGSTLGRSADRLFRPQTKCLRRPQHTVMRKPQWTRCRQRYACACVDAGLGHERTRLLEHPPPTGNTGSRKLQRTISRCKDLGRDLSLTKRIKEQNLLHASP